MEKNYLKKCGKSNKGITLIALIITIIVLLILAGITISALTGSDSAPAKANEAEQKNDIGSAKDQIAVAAINAKTEAYETAYVGNGVAAGDASTTVGQAVIDAVKSYHGKTQGKASIEVIQAETNSIKGNATITITTRDFIVEGTITIEDGILTWEEIEDNVPGIKITNIPSYIAKDGFAMLDVKRRDVSTDAQVTWTSLTTNYATVNSTTGKVTGVAEGTATIKASVTDVGKTYTAQCQIPVREVVVPQVGDFVSYDAGSWTTDESGNILIHYTDGTTEPVANSTNLPSSSYKFGGFTTTNGKNGNSATPSSSNYNYVQEKITTNGITTYQSVTGWRIFDISDNGAITLISSGCCEDYYHSPIVNGGYKSEYILTGEDNSPADVTISELGTTYKIRDWTADYGNSENNITASVLTKSKLDNWYTKYITNGTSADTITDSTFKKIYKTDDNVVNNGKYESLIDNYSYYWLASRHTTFKENLYCVQPDNKGLYTSNGCHFKYGLRVLIYLPSSIKITDNPTGTKTITSRNNDYIYNVWGIN